MLKMESRSRIKSNLMRLKNSDCSFNSFSMKSSIQSPSLALLSLFILSLGDIERFFYSEPYFGLGSRSCWRRLDIQCQRLAPCVPR
ncbi:hypothetical protein MNV_1100009 [Candidatus Methanoperedens nitroreducens]|uniref:Uncharacterized protein n=1 Tax=Candidatus Methanoperedens nitratireducens TaxID=1392998 RepID=A0A284VIY0_9EURY|nr:hypothetical protein MNV_1100009 [Candidatus Methanoperedens nitroreducens]